MARSLRFGYQFSRRHVSDPVAPAVESDTAGFPILVSEVRRVWRTDGMFGVYEVMRTAEGDLCFPVPWASDSSTSFVADIHAYEAALKAAGFEILAIRDRS